MTQLDEAISRYHRILESEPYRDLRWVKNLQDEMEARQLSAGGRLLCPFFRPNFVTQKQYDNLVKTGEALISAVDRMLRTALTSPQLLSRMQLFPAEKMLAAIDPGYEMAEVSAQLDLQIQNGSLHVMQYNADALTGAAWSEGLSDLFYDCPPVKEFRRRYTLTRVGGKKPFLSALLKAYKMFAAGMLGAGLPGREASVATGREASLGNGIKQKPNIAILEFRDPTGRSEYEIYRDYFRAEGFQTELVSPDQLEYRNGVLRSGNFDIDLIYRRISVAGISAAVHAESSAGAGVSRSQGLHREQLPLGALAQEGDVRAVDRRIAHREVPDPRTQGYSRACAVDARREERQNPVSR